MRNQLVSTLSKTRATTQRYVLTSVNYEKSLKLRRCLGRANPPHNTHEEKSAIQERLPLKKTKQTTSAFDVTMGSYDGAEICELVGLYLFLQLQNLNINL